MCFSGCSTVETVSPTYLFIDSSKSITLYLFDDRMINLRSGDYNVTDKPDSSYISGNGVVSHKGSNKQAIFIGTIYFREIKEMRYVEPAPAWQTTPLLIGGAIIVALIVFVSTLKVGNI